MSAVDVLAAWDRQIEWLRDLVATNPGSECHTKELEEAVEARDAVAELMEVNAALLAEYGTNMTAMRIGSPRRNLWVRSRDALARCKGEGA